MIWKCGDCFSAFFPTFPNTKCSAIHPPPWLQHSTSAAPRWTSPGGAAPTPSCSPRRASRGARGPAAAPRPPGLGAAAARPRRRRRGPPARPRASAVERHGSRKVPTAPWREGTFFSICGVVADFWIQISGEKTRFWDSTCFDSTWAVAAGYTDWCCLMLVVNTVACCNLQLSLCGFAAFLIISGCTSLVTGQYSSWLNNTCLLMCWSLWRDWDPHRLSAKSANSCSGPNLSAVASARHRSLGPWWCLSHGCAYHMAMRWSTMSPAWKTKQFQENGQRYAKSSRCGTAPGFSQKLATGLQSMVPALRDLQPYVCTREGGGGQVFWNWQTFVLNGAGKFSSQLIA